MAGPERSSGFQKPWEDRIRETGERVGGQLEDELRRAIRYLDEEVVPEVRRNSSAALRVAAERLRAVAEHLDDAGRRHGGSGS